ncbi:hypothetical protein [Nostoc sp. NMS4]|uniref:hypothetical protein n=1 Tax=Nostoc sp. NMS4 TaxID=2815390 RepID=UPI0025E3C3ED|nr:hypothetical protein [Nostoc sp. NMS4]MBN3923116.1 hypothetical protein [Nostoc sp. NMS4]
MNQWKNETDNFLIVKPVTTLQELSINLCIKEPSSISFSFDALKQNNIIPSDWEVSHSSSATNELIQFIFTNGIRIINQGNSLTFIEPFISQKSAGMRIASIAHKYVNVFSHIKYEAVNTNIRSFIGFESSVTSNKELVHQYIVTLLSHEKCFTSELKPITVVIDLVYIFEQVQLYFKIKEVELNLSNNQVFPSLLFTGIIPHKIELNSTPEKLQLLHFIDSWEKDLNVYLKVLNNFLHQP